MRVKRGFTSRHRHSAILKHSKGFRGRRRNVFKFAKLGVLKALQYATRDRRVKKRDFRSLWILRINAAARENGMSYSQFIRGMKVANIEVNRKILADLAVSDMAAFTAIAEKARGAL